MTRDEIAKRCLALAAQFAREREARRQRTALDPGDFEALAEAGFPQLAVPVAHGGAWDDAASAVRPLCDVLGALAEADPSLALVASMHPAVLGYWLTSPEVGAEHAAAWSQQRDAIFGEVMAGAWWGTITSEPGSGGDVLRTKTRAVPDDDVAGYRLSGDKHFGSGSGMSHTMITTALPDGEPLPDLFFLQLRDVPWDGSRGVTLLAEWDGHGMAATQSHAFRFENFPARRIAAPMTQLQGIPLGIALYECNFAAVVAGVVRVAVRTAAEKLAPRQGDLRAFERVEWSRVRNDAWLIEQALAGMVRALEHGDAPAENALRGKTAIAELAESAMGRLGRVLGGATFSRSAPFGTWAQDVRALGFLRPPWGLAFDQLHGQDFPTGAQ